VYFSQSDEGVHGLVGRLGVAGGEQCCLAVSPLIPRQRTIWYMKPVSVSIEVPQAREDVYDFLDVLANHESFTDHMLGDWRCAGPARGVGARARVTAVSGGRTEALEVEVIEAERPARTVERNVGAGGRVATGTYTLAVLGGGGTRVTFESAWVAVPRGEALAAPLVRAVVRRANKRALERLAGQLQARKAGHASG
jgi:hypothetical protein